MLKKAKITAAAATTTAQARVPNGRIASAEIEEEHGKLLFSFDINTEGKAGIDEVNVDALSGQVVSVQHETPKDEAKERAVDSQPVVKVSRRRNGRSQPVCCVARRLNMRDIRSPRALQPGRLRPFRLGPTFTTGC